MNDREAHLVELVNDDGAAVGSATVTAAHAGAGQLHRAFSVLIHDDAGRLLLQRRAAVKTRFAGRWGNACCGHPAPGEDLCTSAERRLFEELGLRWVPLRPVGVHLYRADDPETGRVEHEYDHVLVGRAPADASMRPDPAEVSEVRWVDVDDLRAGLYAGSPEYVPWLAGVLSVWLAAISPVESSAETQ
jgi:isopentenyl-diphosphate Delta-isomerase